MNDFVFFGKLFGLTVALVLVMQIDVNNQSLETHAMSWLQNSTIVSPLNAVAHGGGKLVHDVTERVNSGIMHNRSKKKKDDPNGVNPPSLHWQQGHAAKGDSAVVDHDGDQD